MPPTKKRPYDATFRFRAFKSLGERIARIIEARGYGDDSEIMRDAIMRHVTEQERSLGLPKMAEEPPIYGKSSKGKRKK